MNGSLLLIPILSTFAGWLISRISIMMLIYPDAPKKILGITVQGLIPKHRNQLTKQLVDHITEKLFSQKEIQQEIINGDKFEKVLPQIEHHIDEFLRHRLGKKMPMIGMLIGENTIRQLKEVFMEELKEIFPAIISSYVSGLQQQMDFREVMIQKINSLPTEVLKPVFTHAIAKDLLYIGLLGSIVGFVTGIIQVLIIITIT